MSQSSEDNQRTEEESFDIVSFDVSYDDELSDIFYHDDLERGLNNEEQNDIEIPETAQNDTEIPETAQTPCTRKQRESTSRAWLYCKVNRTLDCAECNFCKQTLRKDNTSNMWSHLRNHHLERLESQDRYSKDKAAPQENVGTPNNESNESFANREEKINGALVRLITCASLPFSLVENDDFINFVRTIDPKYKLPSRRILTSKLIPEAQKRCEELVAKCLQNSPISVTVDGWKSKAHDNYIGVTFTAPISGTLRNGILACQLLNDKHTGANIAGFVDDVLAKNKIEKSSVVAITTDNERKMLSAQRIFTEGTNIEKVGCTVHLINLCVKDLTTKVESCKKLIDKVKDVVNTIRPSKMADTLTQVQKNAGVNDPLGLVGYNDTRWNSEFAMMERYLQLKDHVLTVLNEHDKTGAPQGAELKKLQKLTEVLRIFKDATISLELAMKPTSSEVIPTLDMIESNLKEKLDEEDDIEVSSWIATLQKSCNDRLDLLKSKEVYQVATLLDPRYKSTYCSTQLEEVKTSVKKVICQKDRREEVRPSAAVASNNTSKRIKLTPSQKYHQQKHVQQQTSIQISESTDNLLTTYVNEGIVNTEEDPIEWWSRRPNSSLKTAALAVLTINPTSVPAERLFSSGGRTVTPLRCSLSPRHVNILLYLQQNRWLPW